MKFTVTLEYKVKRDFPKDVKGAKRWLANELLKDVKGMGKADVSVTFPTSEAVEVKAAPKVAGAVKEKPAGTTTEVVKKKKKKKLFEKSEPVL